MIAGRVILAAAGATGLLGGSPAHSRLERRYEHAYRQVARRFGHRAPGRDIVRSGMPDGRVASASRVRRSLGVLKGMLHPVVVPVASAVVSVTPVNAAPVASTPASSGGAGGVPACASESGTNYSTGPDNTNPSGATGRYQIMPATAAGYGCDLSTPAGQDACAQVIYAHQGAGAWVGCGG